MLRSRWTKCVLMVVLLILVLFSAGTAQRVNPALPTWIKNENMHRFRPDGHADNGFVFCRLKYTSVRRESAGHGWSTDYPRADINFMIRLSELTKTAVDFEDGYNGYPNYWVVEITDPDLFRCPFVMTSDVGTMGLNDEEVEILRSYLLKGGFLWVDDFWGSSAWDWWTSEINKVLPSEDYPIIHLPFDHPLFKVMYNIWEIPQIANIGFWWRNGGETSERGSDSMNAHLAVITDEQGQIMIVMTHNTDIQDSWEREREDKRFFEEFAPTGYALGVNVILYAMSH